MERSETHLRFTVFSVRSFPPLIESAIFQNSFQFCSTLRFQLHVLHNPILKQYLISSFSLRAIIFHTTISAKSYLTNLTIRGFHIKPLLTVSNMATASLYPLATKEELRKQFVGKNLKDVATPAAVLDISKVKQNCEAMLEAAEELKFGWRAHIKTHKV